MEEDITIAEALIEISNNIEKIALAIHDLSVTVSNLGIERGLNNVADAIKDHE